MHIRKLILSALLAGAAAAGGCGGSNEEIGKDQPSGGSAGADGGPNGGTSSGGTSTGGTSSGGTSAGGTGADGGGGCRKTLCQGHEYACGDCADNDRDGKADMDDPDCLGPCHNAENTYYGSIPGQAGPACTVDCYFDQDSGSGNDDCHWNHQCDPLSVGPKYPPEGDPVCAYNPNANTPGTGARCGGTDAGSGMYEEQSTQCKQICGPLTPNGCDCFGCCELPAGGGKYVWLGSETDKVGTCTKADVGNPDKCRPCTPVAGCLNTCQKCELCLGKDTLPDECNPKPTDGGSSGSGGSGGTPSTCNQTCTSGAKCGNGCGPCAAGSFCLTGCCAPIPK
jgi:hypothetical protein